MVLIDRSRRRKQAVLETPEAPPIYLGFSQMQILQPHENQQIQNPLRRCHGIGHIGEEESYRGFHLQLVADPGNEGPHGRQEGGKDVAAALHRGHATLLDAALIGAGHDVATRHGGRSVRFFIVCRRCFLAGGS